MSSTRVYLGRLPPGAYDVGRGNSPIADAFLDVREDDIHNVRFVAPLLGDHFVDNLLVAFQEL